MSYTNNYWLQSPKIVFQNTITDGVKTVKAQSALKLKKRSNPRKKFKKNHPVIVFWTYTIFIDNFRTLTNFIAIKLLLFRINNQISYEKGDQYMWYIVDLY